ncbi:putative aminotransferase [Escherichia coli]|nr:putative aminotransferase [Escherichia coli]
MSPIEKSSKLENVCYDIRGPVLKEAKRLEEEGNKVLKLNIGNPAPFGFDAPDEILVDVIRNLPTAQGYCDSKGLYSARKAIMQHYQARGMRDVTVEDIYIGNGVSELIVQAMQALLNSGDEMLVPAPDYPLWTAAVSLSSGKAVHYLCDESLTGSRTSMIFALKLRLVRVGSLLSTQITQPARYIPKSF